LSYEYYKESSLLVGFMALDNFVLRSKGGVLMFSWNMNPGVKTRMAVHAPDGGIDHQANNAAFLRQWSTNGNPENLIYLDSTNTVQVGNSGGVAGITLDKSTTIGANATLTLKGGAGGARPACTAQLRGAHWYTQGGAGVTDEEFVCMKSAADTYSWRQLLT